MLMCIIGPPPWRVCIPKASPGTALQVLPASLGNNGSLYFFKDLPNQKWLAHEHPSAPGYFRARSCTRLEGAMPSRLKASSSLSCAWQNPWSSPCVPGELRGEVRLWWDGVFTAPAMGESQGWGSCCLQPPLRDFLLLAFWDLGFSLASSMLQDLTSGCCRLIPCSSQIPAAPPVHQIRADLSAPAAPTTRPATWGKCQFPAFSAQSHPMQGAWGTQRYTQRSLDALNPRASGTEPQQSRASPSLPTSSLGFPRAAPSFAALCTAFGACAAPAGGEVLKKIKIKYCKRGSKGFKSFLYSARGHSSVGRRAKLLPHAITGIQHRAPWGPGGGGDPAWGWGSPSISRVPQPRFGVKLAPCMGGLPHGTHHTPLPATSLAPLPTPCPQTPRTPRAPQTPQCPLNPPDLPNTPQRPPTPPSAPEAPSPKAQPKPWRCAAGWGSLLGGGGPFMEESPSRGGSLPFPSPNPGPIIPPPALQGPSHRRGQLGSR